MSVDGGWKISTWPPTVALLILPDGNPLPNVCLYNADYASCLFLFLKCLNVPGMQILDSRDDKALDLHLRFALWQALGVDRLVLHGIRQWSIAFGLAPAGYADPAIWVSRGDENLNLLAADEQMRSNRSNPKHTTSHFLVDLEGDGLVPCFFFRSQPVEI